MTPARTTDVRTRDLADGAVQHRWVQLDHADHPQALAREQVRHALAGRTTPSRIDNAVSVVSELVANAMEHTDAGPTRMTLDVYEDIVLMWVHDTARDTGSVQPRGVLADDPDDIPENGRGLVLVELLAAKWFVWPTAEGKAVVAAVNLSPGGAKW
ncbi:hypothetical protein GCM10009716_47550 [Streptomyces sodiiphilus]|uniref:Histidine kinase/HSP90-like ATPase domain-containing protein n=1 Tax=Streptomyces sodiiphilus TaxID=226217 RepID=A0ABP5BAP0_9ACTN